MKKFILLFLIIMNCQLVFGATNTQILDKIENSLYGYTYSSDSENTRLNRLEEKVYGQSSTGNFQTRISKLQKDISANEIGKEIEPKEDTFATPEDSWVFSKEPVETNKMDYPSVNELEKIVFNKEFKTENLNNRLSKLETKTFGKTYDNDELSIRVDRLKEKINPKRSTLASNNENNDFDNYHLDSYGTDAFDYTRFNNKMKNRQNYTSFGDYSSDVDDYDSYSQNVFKPTKQLNISSIEKALYKTKYENEPMAKRLSRVEMSVFGTEFSQDNESERLMRLSSAINAQKSARKYDSNKFSQNMATAFQIGTLILMVLACIL